MCVYMRSHVHASLHLKPMPGINSKVANCREPANKYIHAQAQTRMFMPSACGYCANEYTYAQSHTRIHAHLQRQRDFLVLCLGAIPAGRKLILQHVNLTLLVIFD